GVLMDKGKPLMMEVNATEKLYGDFVLTATNSGGHSSLPRPENAIYELANALTRLEHYQFPFELNNITRTYYERLAKVETGERAADMQAILKNAPDLEAAGRLSKDPIDNSTMHTTCVATRLSGGHANNALPQTAQANVNCRILPGHSLEETRLTIEKVVADPKIKVQFRENNNVLMDRGSDRHSYVPPAPRREVFDPLDRIVASMWPGIPVLPSMSTGASDGVYTNAAGMPTYAVSGEGYDRDDIRAHGKDERTRVEAFYRGVDFYYPFLKAVTE
ncbi:MAG: M20/M25/M40 family metallo-hydrolase, partial [Acidobacteria bacterium]|nr:M20/M25/M40 family metallo-hydrolase [Acidobacteriota bacterium]